MMYYTYLHRRASDGKPFYIGKGFCRRAWSAQNRNQHWRRTTAKHGLKVDVLAQWKTEAEAFEHEKFLIWCFRDMGCNLVNMTDGGEGQSGWIPSQETRQRISAANKGRRNSPEAAAAQAEKLRGRKQTAEQIEAARMGRISSGAKTDKPVLCIEIEAKFKNIGEAIRWLRDNGHPKASKAAISRVCHGKHKCKSAYGYTWKFIERKD